MGNADAFTIVGKSRGSRKLKEVGEKNLRRFAANILLFYDLLLLFLCKPRPNGHTIMQNVGLCLQKQYHYRFVGSSPIIIHDILAIFLF